MKDYMMDLKTIKKKLSDERNKEIVFVSHCVLNENTRYFGGAFCSGINKSVVEELIKRKVGIVQMECPEKVAWGGIDKKYLWIPFDKKSKSQKILIKLIYPFFVARTKYKYWIIAKKIVKDICDYQKSGYLIKGIIGIDGSPTCGIAKTLDMKESLKYFEDCDIRTLERKRFNDDMYEKCCYNDSGIFIKTLKRIFKRKGIDIPMSSVDLIKEKENVISEILL
jgi:predicted secreted protein